jgi:hypothetical protein
MALIVFSKKLKISFKPAPFCPQVLFQDSFFRHSYPEGDDF